LTVSDGTARCAYCGAGYPVSERGVLYLIQSKSEQNAYFDQIYAEGHLDKVGQLTENSSHPYAGTIDAAVRCLSLCGYNLSVPIDELSILDVGSGAGRMAAGLLQCQQLRSCRIHAFDISSPGLEMLAAFAASVSSSNQLEISVQDANEMRFEPGSFDVIVGSSVLHHFENVSTFLSDCRRILRPGGAMTFGEPFAVGYGLGVAALIIAQRQLGTEYPALEDLYGDLKLRITNRPEILANLVDKHLFFQRSFLSMIQKAGFGDVEFVPLASREFYRDSFIHELLAEREISDPLLAATANEIYRTMFELFDGDHFEDSLAAFIQVLSSTDE